MKKTLLVAAAAFLIASIPAKAGVHVGISVGIPFFCDPAPVCYAPAPAPVVYAPAPAPVVYAPAPAPVYYAPAPAPVVYAPAPVYYAPAPVYVGTRVIVGGPVYRHPGYRYCR